MSEFRTNHRTRKPFPIQNIQGTLIRGELYLGSTKVLPTKADKIALRSFRKFKDRPLRELEHALLSQGFKESSVIQSGYAYAHTWYTPDGERVITFYSSNGGYDEFPIGSMVTIPPKFGYRGLKE